MSLPNAVHGLGPVRRQGVVLEQGFVEGFRCLDGQRGSGGQGGSFEAAADAFQQRLVFRQGEGPALKLDHRPFRNDVGDVSGLGDVQGDAVVAGDLLAQQPDGDLAQHGGVRGVHGLVRGCRRVRGLSGERRLVPAHGLGAGAGRVVGHAVLDGMDHQGQADAVERSAFQQQGLAAAVLLGGRSDRLQRDAQLVHVGLQGKGGGDGGARDQVVPAGVPDVGERIVFHAQCDRQVAAAGARGERRGQAAGAAFHLEAAVGQQRRCRFGRADLLEGDLLVGVDALAMAWTCGFQSSTPSARAARRVAIAAVVSVSSMSICLL